MLKAIYFQTLDCLFLAFFLFLLVTYFLNLLTEKKKTKIFGFLLNAKNNYLKWPNHKSQHNPHPINTYKNKMIKKQTT